MSLLPLASQGTISPTLDNFKTPKWRKSKLLGDHIVTMVFVLYCQVFLQLGIRLNYFKLLLYWPFNYFLGTCPNFCMRRVAQPLEIELPAFINQTLGWFFPDILKFLLCVRSWDSPFFFVCLFESYFNKLPIDQSSSFTDVFVSEVI